LLLLRVRVLILRARVAPRAGGRGAAGRGARGLAVLRLLLAVGLLLSVLRLAGRAVLRLLARLLAVRVLRRLRLAELPRLLAVRLLLRLTARLRPAELRLLLARARLPVGALLARLLGVRVLRLRLLSVLRLAALLRGLSELRSALRGDAELRAARLRLLLSVLRLRRAELRGLTVLRLSAGLLRSAELPALRGIRPLPLGSRPPGEPGLLRAGVAGPCRLPLGAQGRDGPLGGRRLRGLLPGGGPLGLGRGALTLVQGGYRPLGRLGLRRRRGLRRLGGSGFGRRVGHGSARYPTNRREVTPPPELSPDCGVPDARVHLVRTTTDDAILSLQVCALRSHSGQR
jgi:hypothetical protein